MPWGAKPSDGVLDWFFIYRLKLENPIFSGFETRSKVRQADIQLRTIKDLIDTVISWFGLCQCKTQINNSINHPKSKENAQLAQDVKKH
jgi:hypothetical protein